jgi:hypothetical protein
LSRTTLPREVRRALGALERRLFRVLFSFGFGRAAWKACAGILLLYALDRLLDPPTLARLGLTLTLLGFWLWHLRADLLVPMRRRPAPGDLAAWLERADPELRDLLATAVDLSSDAEKGATSSSDFQREILEQAEVAARALEVRSSVPSGRARRSLLAGTAASAALFTLAALQPTEAWIFARRLAGQDVPWPSDTRLTLLPMYVEGAEDALELEPDGLESFRVAIARGSVATVRIHAEGKIPDRVSVRGLEQGARSLLPVGGGEFLLRLPPAEAGWRLEFRGGDDTDGKPALRVDVGDAPAVRDWLVRATPPAYTGAAAEEGPGFEWRLLQGSHLAVRFGTDRPIAAVRAERLDGTEVAVAADAAGGFRFELTADRSDEIAISLTSSDGFVRRRAAVLRWQAEADRPPQLRIVFPQLRWITVPGAEVPVALDVTEDFGFGSVRIVDFDGAETELVVPGQLSLRQVLRLRVPLPASAEAFAEQRLQIAVSAVDQAQPVPQTSHAATPWIEVVSPAVFDQRQAERLVQVRESIAGLRDRLATSVDSADVLTSAFARRVRRDLESLIGEVEIEVITRAWSGLDEGTAPYTTALEPALLQPRSGAGAWLDAWAATGLPRPFERSGLLADLGMALLGARRGPAQDLEAALAGATDPLPPARALLADLDRILEILTVWEDYQSALNLLRDLIQRQREIHLRTQEVTGR